MSPSIVLPRNDLSVAKRRTRLALTVMAVATLMMAFAASGRVRAADVVFPPGARAGLVPPAGFVASRNFRGFENSDKQAAILFVELPQAAFAELEKSMTPEVLTREGVTINKREAITLPDGKGILLMGQQQGGGLTLQKWLMLASLQDMTLVVTVQLPEASKDAYPEAVLRGAIESVKIRPEPLDEKIGLLPFKFGDLAGFRVMQAENNAAVLTDGPKNDVDVFNQTFMLATVNTGGPAQAEARDDFARQSLAALPGFKDIKVTFAEPIRINGQSGYEIRADAKHASSNVDVALVQWIRFGPGGYLRIIGMVPKGDWQKTFPRLRAVRDGIELR